MSLDPGNSSHFEAIYDMLNQYPFNGYSCFPNIYIYKLLRFKNQKTKKDRGRNLHSGEASLTHRMDSIQLCKYRMVLYFLTPPLFVSIFLGWDKNSLQSKISCAVLFLKLGCIFLFCIFFDKLSYPPSTMIWVEGEDEVTCTYKFAN